jgi:glycosyltransferase involved in cell wall biosynthesis
MFELSVVICAHNPRPAYLYRTLEALRNQTLPKERWELLLIDNASRSPLADAWDLSWHPHAKQILESELGLSAARLRGMKESAGDLLVFVDDDNVLDCDYLEQALTIKCDWPLLGAWGSGSIVPEFERQPPKHLNKFISYLALRNNKEPLWSNVVTCTEALPVGAGLCVRANVATAYCRLFEQSTVRIQGRKGTSLGGHEDYEICFVACSNGYGRGVFPELKLTHLIPKERVSDIYLIRLLEETHLSGLILAYKWQGIFPTSPFSVRGILSIIKSLIMRHGFDRRVYFANLRATLKARRMLNQLQRDSQNANDTPERAMTLIS